MTLLCLSEIAMNINAVGFSRLITFVNFFKENSGKNK